MSNNKPALLGQVFLRHSHDLLRFLTRRVGFQDAPDLLQETYLRVLRRAESETITKLYALLYATAINHAKVHQRRRKTEHKYLEFGEIPTETPASDSLPHDQIDGQPRLQLLIEAVKHLPPRCHQVFKMRRFEDLPQDEIARQLGIFRKMVQQHLRVALKRCHEALD